MTTKQKTSKRFTTARIADDAKAGKRAGPWHRPPRPTHSVEVLDARRLRRQRLNGAFGAAPLHVWNHLIKGTANGREKVTPKELTARAAKIREAQMGNINEEDVE